MIRQRLLAQTCQCPVLDPRKDRVSLLVADAFHEDLAQEIGNVQVHAAGQERGRRDDDSRADGLC